MKSDEQSLIERYRQALDSPVPFRATVEPQLRSVRVVGALGKTGAVQSYVTDVNRTELLERVRGGEHVELEVDARTFVQRETPNRNFVRFKKGRLRSIAKTGKGTPFLRDHDQGSVLARGGSVTKSKAITNDDGEVEFQQTLRLTKPWAVEGVLDGTIDRFSIGWNPTAEITYHHSGEPLETPWPAHWPGDQLEDGTAVEWVFGDADLVEVSAVNVPAVVGTGIESFGAAFLSASRGAAAKQCRTPRQEGKPMKRLLEILGLSADASEDSAIAEVQNKDRRIAESDAEVKTLRAKSEGESKELAELRALAASFETEKLDRRIASLYEEGKLVHSAGSTNASERVSDPLEESLRQCYAAGGWQLFDRLSGDLKARVPVGRSKLDTSPQVRGGADKVISAGNVAITLDHSRRVRMRKLGLTEESYQRYVDKLAASDNGRN